MKKKIVSVVLLVILLCIGCRVDSENSEICFSDTLPIMAREQKINDKKLEKIGIYVDTTPSMQGFLGMQEQFYKNIVGDTAYSRCLDEIDNLISVNYDRVNIDYYRVDTPLWRTKENVLIMAKKHDYYDDQLYTDNVDEKYEMIDLIEYDGARYDSYCLTNALLNCIQDDFSIIVTDFYENEVASSEVTTALKKNMFFNNNADRTIGIVGIKSEFAGKIFDLPGQEHSISYGIIDSTGTTENIMYRQFFVIVIGNPGVVREFCNALQESMELKEGRIVSTIFYEDELYGLDYQNYRKCFSRNDGRKNYFMPMQKMIINDKEVPEQYVYNYKNVTEESREIIVSYVVNSDSLKERLRDGDLKTVSISVPDPCEKELFEIPFIMENGQVSVWNGNEKFVIDEDYTGLFEIQHIYYSQQENLLYVVFRIINDNTLTGGIKFYGEIKTNMEYQKELYDWVDEWNFSNQNVSYEKTWRLKDYVNAMKNKMPERNRVLLKFAFYIYID